MNCAQYLQSSYHVNSDFERFSFKYTKSCNPLNLYFLSRNNLRGTKQESILLYQKLTQYELELLY